MNFWILMIMTQTIALGQHHLADLRETSHIAVGTFIQRYAMAKPQLTHEETSSISSTVAEATKPDEPEEEPTTWQEDSDAAQNLVLTLQDDRLHISHKVIQVKPGEIVTIDRESEDIYIHSFESQNAKVSNDYQSVRIQAATKLIITYFSQMEIVDISTTQSSVSLAVSDEEEEHSEEVQEEPEIQAGVRLPQKPTPSVFAATQSSVEYIKMRIQFVDDRSSQDALYPVTNLRIMIPGFDEPLISNEKGEIELPSVPRFSRLVLLMNDPIGRHRQHQYEVYATTSEQVVLLRREELINAYEQTSSYTTSSHLASVCGTVFNSQNAPMSQIQVRSNLNVERILYFDDLGTPSSGATSYNGRFCAFGVRPGPNAFYFYNEHQQLIHIAMSGLYAGYHMEESFHVQENTAFDLRVFSYAGANEQFSSDPNLAYRMSSVDMTDITAIGNNRHFYYVDDAQLRMDAGVFSHKGRSYVLAQSAEFESSFHVINSSGQDEIRLFPRGYLEDIATLLGHSDYQADLGSLFVEFSSNHHDVKVKIIDERNKEVAKALSYSQTPIHKSMFFDIEPGYYTVVIETADGLWLAQDSVYIYHQTHSTLHFHNKLAF
jgi:hypothetical protein